MIASLTSVDALREYVADGDTIGVGGAGLVRKPMALLRALVAAGIRDLRVVSFLGSVDVEYLIAAGVVNQLHSAGVSLDGFGLAPAFRAARQGGTIEFVEWSEGSLTAAVEASARGLPSLACSTAPASDVVVHNAWLGTYPDPPTEVPTVFATALDIDVALIHAAGSDADSNIYVEGDLALDGLLARALQRAWCRTKPAAKPIRQPQQSHGSGWMPWWRHRVGPGRRSVIPRRSSTSGPLPAGLDPTGSEKACWSQDHERHWRSIHCGSYSRIRGGFIRLMA